MNETFSSNDPKERSLLWVLECCASISFKPRHHQRKKEREKEKNARKVCLLKLSSRMIKIGAKNQHKLIDIMIITCGKHSNGSA